MAAIDTLTLHLQPTIDPAVSDDELEALLAGAVRPDSEGRSPTDDEWEETYCVAQAIADGWRLKAAKASGAYAFADGNLSLHREQVVENCLKMEKQWRRRVATSVEVLPAYREYDDTEDDEEEDV